MRAAGLSVRLTVGLSCLPPFMRKECTIKPRDQTSRRANARYRASGSADDGQGVALAFVRPGSARDARGVRAARGAGSAGIVGCRDCPRRDAVAVGELLDRRPMVIKPITPQVWPVHVGAGNVADQSVGDVGLEEFFGRRLEAVVIDEEMLDAHHANGTRSTRSDSPLPHVDQIVLFPTAETQARNTGCLGAVSVSPGSSCACKERARTRTRCLCGSDRTRRRMR